MIRLNQSLKWLSAVIVAVFLGCAGHVFENVTPAEHPDYGYSPEYPIQLGYWEMDLSLGANVFYLRHLVTEDGDSLYVLSHATVSDPSHMPWEDESRSYIMKSDQMPTTGVLDVFTVVPAGTQDTMQIYFDNYHTASLQVPQGLIFVPPQ